MSSSGKSGERDQQESAQQSAAESAQRRPEADTEHLSSNAARLAEKAMPGGDVDGGDAKGADDTATERARSEKPGAESAAGKGDDRG